MGRGELLSELVVSDDGLVTSEGSFLGQPAYVPYFWEKHLNGWADAEADDGDPMFMVFPEDISEFPELRWKKMIKLHLNGATAGVTEVTWK